MPELPREIFSAAAVREIDRIAIEERGIEGYTLMQRAAEAAVAAARERYPAARRWTVVCGAGNNAGDGYVVARHLKSAGCDVRLYALVEPTRLDGDAKTAHADYAADGGDVAAFGGKLGSDTDIIVDALLGSGLERPVAGDFADAVEAMNRHAAPIVALDIPTGLHGDTGAVLGTAVAADLTVTFVGLKAGLFINEGPEHAGDIAFAGLGVPDDCRAAVPLAYRRSDAKLLRSSLGRRRRSAHKGDFGHVLVVGGGAGMPGAARLCAEGALRAGAGRVSVATETGHAAMLVASRPEVMSHGITDVAELDKLLDRADVVAFGPGLGRGAWAQALFDRLSRDPRPAVWDADALFWLARCPAARDKRIITPHPGEAGALLGISASDVQADRRAALAALRDRYGGVVALKGAGTLVSSEDGPPWLCTAGNPGMATAGVGDVLTGIVAAFLAQGMREELAAAVAVAVHARAGDRAAMAGERGLVASDLLAELRTVVNPCA